MTLTQLTFDQSWAGRIPPRWRWSRNKELLTESLALSVDGDEELLSVSHLTGITPRSEKTVTMTAAENLEGYRIVEPGDLVINTMWAWMGALGIAKQAGIVSPAYGVYSPRPAAPCEPRFYDYVYRSEPYVMEMTRLSRGIWSSRLRLYPDVFLSMAVPVPPLNEQRAIADYLDRETARIDTLIEEQQRLIEMLRERRRAVALHAIDQQIHAGATTDKLGRSTRIGNGSTPRRETASYWRDGEFPWLNSSAVNESRVTHADQFVTDIALYECHLPVVAPGSVLVGLTGQGKTRGMATLLEIEATVNQHVAYIAPDRGTWLPEYLLWSLRASYDDLRRLSEENGSTKGGLTCQALKQYRLAVPPLDEQRRVAAYLDEQTAKIDTLTAETDQFIELARERRAALITAAVTGQVDVRGMV
ncbi:hypothetical protein UK99_05600 [Frankia casuarinae]|uniref:restriction endonuclease subunit S n=1 Tax=Frankia casuarinae (strain DSM 45818 / CECT 9043 / HFP020203 / CcI3) TaxID=106370 RepID=UPI000A11459C|nr:restriction endonuclease subunit S [Frankia casuarinae]ORT97394.1 hypothetical protein UK99_05600 [Frankia casuarinae]